MIQKIVSEGAETLSKGEKKFVRQAPYKSPGFTKSENLVRKEMGKSRAGKTTTPRNPGQAAIMGARAADITGKADTVWFHLIALCLGGPQAARNLVTSTKFANMVLRNFEVMLRDAVRVLGSEVKVKATAFVTEGTNIGKFFQYDVWIDGEHVVEKGKLWLFGD